MICRHWHGWTRREDAGRYQTLLTGTILPEILARGIEGLISSEAMARDIVAEDGTLETEHVTQIRFTSIEAVKAFMGEDYELAHIPEEAKAVLKRWDATATHYEVLAMQDRGART